MNLLRVLIIVGFGCALSAQQPVIAGEKTALSGQTLTGSTLTVDTHQPTLLIFWASWCGTCLAEIPQLKTLHQQLGATVQFIGVNVNKLPADGAAIVRDHALPYPSLSDPDLVIADQYTVQGTPTLIALDEQGRTIRRSHRLDKPLVQALESLSR